MNYQQQNQPAQLKKIQIINLSQKVVKYNDPQKGPVSFTIYQLHGNDGITYETTDRAYFDLRKIGESLDANYSIYNRSSGGKIYTNYRLQTPKLSPSAPIIEALRKTYSRIELAEKNIIAAIRMTKGEPTILGPEDVSMPEDINPDEIDKANGDLQEASEDLGSEHPF